KRRRPGTGEIPVTGRLVDLGLTEATHPPSPFRATGSCSGVPKRDWRRHSPAVMAIWRQYSTWKVFSQVVLSDRFAALVYQFSVRALLDAPGAPHIGPARGDALDGPTNSHLTLR